MMLKCLKPLGLVAALSLSAPTAMAADASDVVASVNGKEITLGHMIQVYEELPQQYKSLSDDVIWTGILDQLIQQTLLAETASEAGAKRVGVALENQERQLLAQSVIGAIAEAATTQAALQEAYGAAFADGGGKEYNASHILVETQEEAAGLAEQARGGTDFAGLAREHSTGPSGPNGGELGWFGEGQMVAPFEAAVKELSAGEISDPVQTQFGWHVIKLNETRILDAPELAEVRAELEGQIQTEAVEKRIQELMSGAEITRTEPQDTDPSLLKDSGLLD